jgi:hypothetical protein
MSAHEVISYQGAVQETTLWELRFFPTGWRSYEPIKCIAGCILTIHHTLHYDTQSKSLADRPASTKDKTTSKHDGTGSIVCVRQSAPLTYVILTRSLYTQYQTQPPQPHPSSWIRHTLRYSQAHAGRDRAIYMATDQRGSSIRRANVPNSHHLEGTPLVIRHPCACWVCSDMRHDL